MFHNASHIHLLIVKRLIIPPQPQGPYNLVQRRVLSNEKVMCCVCKLDIESLQHLLFGCDKFVQVWNKCLCG